MITVWLDGEPLSFDQPPIKTKDRVLVPLRVIFEKLGSKVEWEGSTQTVTAVKGKTTVTLQVGSKVARKDGKSIPLDVEPITLNDRTLVPVRFVSEALGAKVEWDGAANRVDIFTK
ncbi:copper amine oxidase N-terminal domain-containing protein [Effusibacillus lacus]|uniref:Copper amine oxidase-like N-terminal domain-containing protein n=1 Tax=Effusibacillus lacus TaxID=1348429 RepID=A0A292YLS8_9BACL|nr:copper amine oxidase N-terminal domain-containing protein [Effusibacillus lacus]TCS73740.1 copper amine oxidase-like protein [Effusibacillus lacus]GAX92047.1 hypothetical protein EFBL_3738 [Effusibacillus lacus]